MTRLIRIIGTACLIGFFLLPAVGYGWAHLNGAAAQTSENRNLAAWPEWTGTLRSYTAAIDDHLEDRFGGRMLLIRFARKVRDNLGENAPEAVRGQAPWLYLGEHVYRDEFEGQGPWDAEQVNAWVSDVNAVAAELKDQGIPFAFTVAPDKSRIYPEFLPADWTEGSRRFRNALRDAPGLDDIFVDVEPAVLGRKAAGERVYWSRDTHWTPSGSYAAAMVLLDALDPERTLPRYSPAPAKMRDGTKLYDLEAMLGYATSTEPRSNRVVYPILDDYAVTRPHLNADGKPARAQFATLVAEDNAETGGQGTLVIVGDSFADNMLPHVKYSFDRVVRIHNGAGQYTVGTDEILSYDPDAVLFMIVERTAVRKKRPIRVGASVRVGGETLGLPQ